MDQIRQTRPCTLLAFLKWSPSSGQPARPRESETRKASAHRGPARPTPCRGKSDSALNAPTRNVPFQTRIRAILPERLNTRITEIRLNVTTRQPSFFQILLVVILGYVELACRLDLGDDWSPKAALSV